MVRASSGWIGRTSSPPRPGRSASPHLELLGLHAFGASNVLDADALVEHVATIVQAARRLALGAGVPLRLIDAGGGLGIPYEPDQPVLDLVRLGAGLAELDGGLVG